MGVILQSLSRTVIAGLVLLGVIFALVSGIYQRTPVFDHQWATFFMRWLHVMSGMIAPGADTKAMHRTFVSNLKKVCDRTAKSGITIVLEPINHRDIPGYFTNTTDQVKAIIDEVGAPHLRLQLDLYHLQVTEGDLQKRMERLFPITSHVQIAGNPDRNEPDIGEVNHLYLLDVLDRLGYDGYVGLEYKPKTTTGAGLGWAGRYGIKA